MNKIVDTKLAIAIIVIVALIVGGIILISFSNNQTAQAPSQVANKPVSKNDQQSIPQENKDKVHMAFETEVNGKVRVIYDGKDMGIACDEIFDLRLSGDDIIFDCRQGENTSGGEGHVILNGKDLGRVFRPNIENGNVSFLQQISSESTHLIFNSQDVGEVNASDDWEFSVSGKHFAMQRMISGKGHIIYDGKDLGEGRSVSLGENSIAFIRDINNNMARLIYNEKEITSDKVFGIDIINVADSGVVYTKSSSKLENQMLYKNDQNFGEINDAVMTPIFENGNYAFANKDGNIIFNGKNLGLAKTEGNAGSRVQVSGNHIIFVRGEAEKIPRVIYDGKDLGEGVNPTISGDNIAYNIEVNGKQHVLFNGKDMGEGTEPQLAGNNLAFYLEKQGAKHVIYNGKDLGEGGGIEFSEN